MSLSKHDKEILFSDFPENSIVEKQIEEFKKYAKKVFSVKFKIKERKERYYYIEYKITFEDGDEWDEEHDITIITAKNKRQAKKKLFNIVDTTYKKMNCPYEKIVIDTIYETTSEARPY